MKKYDSYKDSGVNWIGEIPSHWETTPFSHFFQIRKDIAGKEGYDVLSVTQTGIKVKDIEHNEGQIALDYSKYQFADPGDFIMNHMDLITGYIGRAESLGVTSPDYRVFRAFNKDAYEDYYLLVFQLCYKWKVFFGLGQGVANKGRWRLPANQLKKFQIPVPPIKEQKRIAYFLNTKTKEIDELIRKIEREIELLKEYKQAEIACVVTHGLNPDVTMKPSGVSWIGDIPAHWEIKTLRNYLRMVSDKGHPEEQLLSVVREQGVIIRDVDSIEENHNFIPDDLSGYKLVKVGQFAINKMKSWQGSYGVSLYQGIVSPAYYVCDLNFANKRFFNEAIRSKVYVPFFTQYSKGIRVGQWDLSPIGLKSIPFIEPPVEEQEEIVSYIDRKTTEIDRLVVELTYQVEYLKEYKQRLIADVVTGKINVQND